MAKFAFLLALSHATLLYGLPTGDKKRHHEALDGRAITLSSDLAVTTSYVSTLETLQSATQTLEPTLTGSILTGLPSGITRDPVAGPTPVDPTKPLAPIQSTLDPGPTSRLANADPNIFVPMASDAPPQQIPRRDDHVVEKIGILDEDAPIATNKFYANFFLGSQKSNVWTHPYSLRWAGGRGDTWGMAISHVERSQFAFGEGDVPRYFIGPVGLQHIVLSAAELGEETTLSTESLTAFSVYANLAPYPDADPILSIPCVQGMGFVTGLYNGATPQLSSGTFFRTLEYIDLINDVTYKYKITLEDNTEWLLYATPIASLGAPPFELVDSTLIEGPGDFVGMIQVAKNPAGAAGEAVYDSTAGAFAVNATISGAIDGSAGAYTLSWYKDGIRDRDLLMFALPHHVESFDQETRAGLTDISLVTTTKGYARAVKADKFTMVESNLPDSIGFAPWTPSASNQKRSETINLNAEVLATVNHVGALELGENFDKQTRLDSMYYSGKALAKFAGIIITLQDISHNTELAAAGLVKLKDALNVFVNNTQPLPLVYDTVWKGVVSSGTYKTGDTGLDFGNALYNDHHFHYGYFVYTAAVIGYLDPKWLDEGTNRAWINTLVRDFANPSAEDPYFPFQRSFDWFHGHSWAKGLFESGDGKDQESTSEDTFSSYALKMWGKVSGDANMEARGNLQLAVQARSLKNYFLLEEDNNVQPKQFLPNRVTGILFENKVDHTTYFGGRPEYIQGIHMIPLNPTSAYTRSQSFMREEWDTYFSDGRVDEVEGGWRGILYGNLALIDPAAAYDFFSDPNFDMALLDGGSSLTWYLAYSAALATASGVDLSAAVAVNADEGEGEIEYSDEDYYDEDYYEEEDTGEDYAEEDYVDEGYYEDDYTEEDYIEEDYAKEEYVEDEYAEDEQAYDDGGYVWDEEKQVWVDGTGQFWDEETGQWSDIEARNSDEEWSPELEDDELWGEEGVEWVWEDGEWKKR